MDAAAWISTILKIVFILIIILTFAPLLIWAERRQSAMIQDRVGPTRAHFKLFGKKIALIGLLHPLADALKFMWKEDFIPPKADKLLHSLAPIIAVVPALAAFTVIPFGDKLYLDHLFEALPANPGAAGIPLQVASLNVGILFVFALGGTGVVGAALAGYCSDNKFSLLGGLRAASQMVSYEVTLGLSLVGCFMLYNTLLLEEMVRWQAQHLWGIVYQPLAFVLFLTASIAETKRIPFDVPESESELAAGYFTEYSGMKFGMFMMGEFIELVASSSLITVIFLAGHHFPFLAEDGIRLASLHLPIPHIIVVVLGVLIFLGKVVCLCWLNLMIRWSLPRFRYDQIMNLCWRYMLPLSLANIFVTGVGILLFGG
jgi:NADH-quinone oxidoreductase subunit H